MKTFVLISFLALLVGSAYSHKPSKSFIYKRLSKPEIQIESLNPQSKDHHDGTLSIRIVGGVPPYTSQVIGTYSPAQTFYKERFEISGIGVGTYTIIVQDNAKQVVQKLIELTAN